MRLSFPFVKFLRFITCAINDNFERKKREPRGKRNILSFIKREVEDSTYLHKK